MKVNVSYSIELKHINKIIEPTVQLFRNAVTYIIKVYEQEYDDLDQVAITSKEKFNVLEHLLHNTATNIAKYDFDQNFYKMPSYMRRAAIQKAIGIVDSYKSNYQNWLDNGSKGNVPKLRYDHIIMPTFYNGVMSKNDPSDPYTIYLKLYINHDYKFIPVKLKKTDKDYILRHYSNHKCSCPTLEKRYGKYYLRFCIEVDTPLSTAKIEDRIICSVDLGINTDATVSIIHSDGTILKRKFINFQSDKDHLYHVLNRIKRYQQEGKGITKLWRYATHINDQLASKIANEISNIAISNQVDVIVFEHLDTKGKKKGSKKQKLQMWNKNAVQNIVNNKAHQHGIRIAHINARNTSKLAYDGTGPVERNKNNYSLCTFTSGKHYNCDLNASYNIGARYFIKEKIKTFSEKKRLEVEAKVPALTKRTTCTLNTLWQLNAVM